MLGVPLEGTSLHLLDENLAPIAPPVSDDAPADDAPQGQIAIGGEQLAIGYLHRAELTAERFVTADALGGMRLYLTGDLARWSKAPSVHEAPGATAEPMLRLCGRVDNQVKVNGVRLELGEVEVSSLVLTSCGSPLGWFLMPLLLT